MFPWMLIGKFPGRLLRATIPEEGRVLGSDVEVMGPCFFPSSTEENLPGGILVRTFCGSLLLLFLLFPLFPLFSFLSYFSRDVRFGELFSCPLSNEKFLGICPLFDDIFDAVRFILLLFLSYEILLCMLLIGEEL